MPGDATGLLVDGIQLVNPPAGDYYYAIHATSQMASAGDWGSEADGTGFYKDGLTDDALSLLNGAANSPISPAANIPAGGTFTDDKGIEWLVVAEERGHKLIMTKYAYGYSTLYNLTDTYTPLDSGSNLKTALQIFYEDQVGNDAKAVTVPYISPLPDENSSYGFDWLTTGTDGYSHPNGRGTAEKNGSNAVFVLSITEATLYPTLDNNAKRRAYDASDTSVRCHWWLRSPGPSISSPFSVIHKEGEVYGASGTGVYFRPALWIKS
jgi:hypothetical protein